MKENVKKIKAIILFISLIIIIAGIAAVLIAGFNFDLKYQQSKQVELYINKEFNINDVKQIAEEVMPGQDVIIQKVEVFEDTISIISNDINEEQKNNLVTKINEKYETELNADEIDIVSIPHTKLKDILKPFVLPFIIATIIILFYIGIRYNKIGIVKATIGTAAVLIWAQTILFSIMAIARIPIGMLTGSMIFIVYIVTLIATTTYLEKRIAEIKEKEEE